MNTALVTNSRATRWMLRRIWRPSWTIRGTSPNSPAHEHEVGDRARHLRARALGDREPRLLERGDVVDAVAEHRRRTRRRRPARRTTRALSSGEMRPIAGAARTASSSASGSRRAARRRRAPAPIRRDARVARDRADRRRAVAGEHLERDLLGGEEGDRVGRRSARSRSARTTSAERAQRRPGSGGVGRGRRQRRAAAARAPARGGRRRPRSDARSRSASRRRRAKRLRRAEHEPVAVQLERAPAPPRRERHLGRRLQRAVAVGQLRGVRPPRASRCATARSRRSAPSARASVVLVDPVGRHQLDDPQRRLGQRAGLVGAQDRRPTRATRSR